MQATKRILLIADGNREIAGSLALALPGATIRQAASVFDGIAELAQDGYTAVLAATEPVARRPEAAVRTLRELAGDGRLVLFSDPSLEPLSRKMLEFGCDDYLVTPVTADQVQKALILAERDPPVTRPATPPPPLRLHTDYDDPRLAKPAAPAPAAPACEPALTADAISDILLSSLLDHPGDAIAHAVDQMNERLTPLTQLAYIAAGSPARTAPLAYPVAISSGPIGSLLAYPTKGEEAAAQALLNQIGPLLCKAAAVQHRQSRLQKLAFTDDLTGLFNCRYFNHYLNRILTEARKARFPVTLFLFDIDNFKSYNDRFGHGVGDDILKQTAALMRRCVRDHDVVARIGGDEFAVVFWEKEGPRMSRESNVGTSGRPPSEPEQILARFRRLLETETYPLLGSTGRGTLTISGGLAVFPYDAGEVKALIEAADKALMFGAKRSGRNSIALVGSAENDLNTETQRHRGGSTEKKD